MVRVKEKQTYHKQYIPNNYSCLVDFLFSVCLQSNEFLIPQSLRTEAGINATERPEVMTT